MYPLPGFVFVQKWPGLIGLRERHFVTKLKPFTIYKAVENIIYM
jgi:hypothetical protein